jgi:hypothetical protein
MPNPDFASERNTMTPEQIGTLKYIAESPPEAHGGFAAQTVEAAKWALAEIERLQAELAQEQQRNLLNVACCEQQVKDLKAEFAPTIAVLEEVSTVVGLYTGFADYHAKLKNELARLRAIVEKGTK